MPEYDVRPFWRRHLPLAALLLASALMTPTSVVMFFHCLLQARPTCVPWRPPLTELWGTLALASPTALAVFWNIALNRKRAGIPEYICPHCAYDRRGLAPNAKCPECGTLPAAAPN